LTTLGALSSSIITTPGFSGCAKAADARQTKIISFINKAFFIVKTAPPMYFSEVF
jgi:hypothetical protein